MAWLKSKVSPEVDGTPAESAQGGASATGEARRAPRATPIVPDITQRTQILGGDNAPLLYEFVRVVDGEFKDRQGVFQEVLNYDEQTGFPLDIIVKSPDGMNNVLKVSYDQVRPTRRYKGGR